MARIAADLGIERIDRVIRPFDELDEIAVSIEQHAGDIEARIVGPGDLEQLQQFIVREQPDGAAEIENLLQEPSSQGKPGVDDRPAKPDGSARARRRPPERIETPRATDSSQDSLGNFP